MATMRILTLQKDKLQHEMYWNTLLKSRIEYEITDKLQHEMYWNRKANEENIKAMG